MKASSSGATAANVGAWRTASSSMPCILLAAAGIGTPGLTSRSKLSASRRPSPPSRTAPICTSRAVRASSPVVSVSITTASSPNSGVDALLWASLRACAGDIGCSLNAGYASGPVDACSLPSPRASATALASIRLVSSS